MNGDFGYTTANSSATVNRTANQLDDLASLNARQRLALADRTPELDRAVPLDDPNATLEHKVRSYVDNNCGFAMAVRFDQYGLGWPLLHATGAAEHCGRCDAQSFRGAAKIRCGQLAHVHPRFGGPTDKFCSAHAALGAQHPAHQLAQRGECLGELSRHEVGRPWGDPTKIKITSTAAGSSQPKRQPITQ